MSSTIVVEDEILDSLMNFGDPKELTKEAIKQFIIENCKRKLKEIKNRLKAYEKRYGFPFGRFQYKIRTEERFAQYVEQNIEPNWESDLIEWEFDTRELSRWSKILKTISD